MVALTIAICLGWSVVMTVGRGNALVANRWNAWLVAIPIAALAAGASGVIEDLVSDRNVYAGHFASLGAADDPWAVQSFSREPLFNALLWILARLLPTTETALFTAIGVAIAAGVLAAYSRLVPAWAVLPAFLTLIASGLFAGYSGVVIRQGLAIACLLMAVALAATRSRRPLWLVVLLIAAPLFHWTAILPAVVTLVLYLRDLPLKPLLAGWAVLVVMFVGGLQQMALGNLVGWMPAIADYSTSEARASYGAEGNRLDFLALSAVILIACLAVRSWVGVEDSVADRLLAAYILWNGMFLLLGFIAFSDRLASYSWFLAPSLVWRLLAHLRASNQLPLAGLGVVLALGLVTGAWTQLAAV